ncbi:MAG TPA: CHAT domain-containing protein [Polyangiaceae bacterium]|nr:CHAT domain-containing protein [Polyangiaceae bacterium]
MKRERHLTAEGASMEKRTSLWQSILSLVAAAQGAQDAPGDSALIRTGDGAPARENGRVRVLFLGSNPALANARRDVAPPRAEPRPTYDPLALDEEARSIDRALSASPHASSFDFVTKWAVRCSEVQEHLLRHRPHVVHLSGHGDERAGLVLLDAGGNPKRVSGDALAGLFKVLRGNVRVVLLNACWSADQASAISQFVDCVIGMRQPLDDAAAIAFAAAFYGAIAFGMTVRDAFELGKLAVEFQGLPGSHVPQLFERPAGPRK